MGLRSGWAGQIVPTFWVGSPAQILPPEPAPDVGRTELRETAAEEAQLLLQAAAAGEALANFASYGTEPLAELPIVPWYADWAEDAAERSVSDLLRKQAEQHVADFAVGSVTEVLPPEPPGAPDFVPQELAEGIASPAGESPEVWAGPGFPVETAPDIGRVEADETAAERAHRFAAERAAGEGLAAFQPWTPEPVPELPVVPFWPLEEDLKAEGASLRALAQAAAEALASFQAYGTEPLADVPVVIWFAGEDDLSAEIAAWESYRRLAAAPPDPWAPPAESLPPVVPELPLVAMFAEGQAPWAAAIPEWAGSFEDALDYAGNPAPDFVPAELAAETSVPLLQRGWTEGHLDSFFYGDWIKSLGDFVVTVGRPRLKWAAGAPASKWETGRPRPKWAAAKPQT